MGNALRLLAECVCGSESAHQGSYGYSSEAGYAAFARDLLHFETTGQIPEGLASYVTATRATQVIWYRKLLEAWKFSNPPPSNASEVAKFIVDTLQTRRKSDAQGILQFYGLPHPVLAPTASSPSTQALYPKWPQGVQYEFTTLPVDAHEVPDGDTLTVFVDVTEDGRESKGVPPAVLKAISKRRNARAKRDYDTADALQREISLAGYKSVICFLSPLILAFLLRVFDAKNGSKEIVAHKYRIRLRGVDAPEKIMPHGPESRAELIKIVEGQALRVYVYTADQYGRLVADVHTEQGFVQEMLLKRGCVWHYTAYDHREDLSEWEQEARNARRGLWASRNPQKPWEFRKERR